MVIRTPNTIQASSALSAEGIPHCLTLISSRFGRANGAFTTQFHFGVVAKTDNALKYLDQDADDVPQVASLESISSLKTKSKHLLFSGVDAIHMVKLSIKTEPPFLIQDQKLAAEELAKYLQ